MESPRDKQDVTGGGLEEESGEGHCGDNAQSQSLRGVRSAASVSLLVTYHSWTFPGGHLEMHRNTASLRFMTGTNEVL